MRIWVCNVETSFVVITLETLLFDFLWWRLYFALLMRGFGNSTIPYSNSKISVKFASFFVECSFFALDLTHFRKVCQLTYQPLIVVPLAVIIFKRSIEHLTSTNVALIGFMNLRSHVFVCFSILFSEVVLWVFRISPLFVTNIWFHLTLVVLLFSQLAVHLCSAL